MKLCIYCNEKAPNPIMVKFSKKDNAIEYPCCSEECFKKAERFFKRSSIAMLVVIPTLILYVIVSALVLFGHLPRVYTAFAGVIMGGEFLICPFSTKHNVESLCIKTIKVLSRIVGGFIVLMGILMMF